jgi:hypothetical protein
MRLSSIANIYYVYKKRQEAGGTDDGEVGLMRARSCGARFGSSELDPYNYNYN